MTTPDPFTDLLDAIGELNEAMAAAGMPDCWSQVDAMTADNMLVPDASMVGRFTADQLRVIARALRADSPEVIAADAVRRLMEVPVPAAPAWVRQDQQWAWALGWRAGWRAGHRSAAAVPAEPEPTLPVVRAGVTYHYDEREWVVVEVGLMVEVRTTDGSPRRSYWVMSGATSPTDAAHAEAIRAAGWALPGDPPLVDQPVPLRGLVDRGAIEVNVHNHEEVR